MVTGPGGEAKGRNPGPESVVLPAALRDALVGHALAGYPNEACGIVVGSAGAAEGGRPLRFVATRNAAASPFRYEIDHDELLRVSLEIDDRDEAIWAIFHSHTHSPARPSPTDVGLAFYPEALYVLASLDPGQADPATGGPGLRAWRIVGGETFEVRLNVEPDPAAGEAGGAEATASGVAK